MVTPQKLEAMQPYPGVDFLGAGYDTRPYRLEALRKLSPERQARFRVFEVDQGEGMQTLKKASLKRQGLLPEKPVCSLSGGTEVYEASVPEVTSELVSSRNCVHTMEKRT